MSALKQKRPFSVTISAQLKRDLMMDAKMTGIHKGVFFNTSGKAMLERINPSAQYNYVWRTDQPNKPKA